MTTRSVAESTFARFTMSLTSERNRAELGRGSDGSSRFAPRSRRARWRVGGAATRLPFRWSMSQEEGAPGDLELDDEGKTYHARARSRLTSSFKRRSRLRAETVRHGSGEWMLERNGMIAFLVRSPGMARKKTWVLLIAVVMIVGCGGRATTGAAGEGGAPLSACAWPAALDSTDASSSSACHAARAFVQCIYPGGGEGCLSGNPTKCEGPAPLPGPASCQDQCREDEYAVSCGAPDPPAGCHDAVPSPDGVIFYCCPCS